MSLSLDFKSKYKSCKDKPLIHSVEFILQQCKEDEDYYDILTVSGMLK